jgi:hypothetical protein
MPRKDQTRVRGVWEKVPGSGIWWIRYRIEGKLKREKVGRKGDAIDLYRQRKSDARAGAKLPSNLRNAGVKFKELADAVLVYSASHHRDTKNIKIRLAKIRSDFDELIADKVKPEEIDAWLTAHTGTPATSNRYRALFSLVYREALRNGKVTSNPARLVRQRHEDNINIRWLTPPVRSPFCRPLDKPSQWEGHVGFEESRPEEANDFIEGNVRKVSSLQAQI